MLGPRSIDALVSMMNLSMMHLSTMQVSRSRVAELDPLLCNIGFAFCIHLWLVLKIHLACIDNTWNGGVLVRICFIHI